MSVKNIQFSFGQTSGFLLRKMMDEYGARFDKEFIVTFENTGKEHDKTLDFGHAVEKHWGVHIVWLEYTRIPAIEIPWRAVPEGRKRANLLKKQASGESDHWFRIVNYQTAARDSDTHTPFDCLLSWSNVLPNVATRMCSVQMKLRTRDRYLRSLGVMEFDSFIGIRSDESHRCAEILANVDKYENPHFPLVSKCITKQSVDSWWDRQPFKLEIPNYFGNCKFCYLKSRYKRLLIAKQDRPTMEWPAEKERQFRTKTYGAGAFFKEGESYEGLLSEADNQTELPITDEDVPCSCAVGGYRGNTEDADNDPKDDGMPLPSDCPGK